MRVLALLALLQIGAAPRTSGKSHGVIHDTMLEGVTFQDYGQGSSEGTPAPPGTIVLEPPSLDFGARPLGAAHAERVTLYNRSNSTLRLASISGSTHNFHASFFESKVVPPAGNTSFSVVFLGRREGAVDSHLYLHTSLGSHKYAVSGVALMSEYRLSPLVGVKLPRNTSFSPTIYMHNPHPHPIQIMEVYSSGGGVSLELPDGGTEGPQSLWLLPPHTTRAVVRVHYSPQHPHPPHTAYIRIKLNGTSPVLVVPVDVGVERDAGPYVRPHAVHAGLAGSRDPPTQIRLAVGNSGGSWVRLRQASLWRENDSATAEPPVDIELVEHSLPPYSPPAHAATLHLYWDRIYESGATYGEIRLTTADHCLTVPYHAHAIPGALVYNDTQLSFVTSTHDVMMSREFSVRNDFSSAVHITDVEMSDTVRKHFVLSGFTPRSLPAGATVDIFSLRLRELNASLTLSSHVTLVTNVTSYRVSVFLYSGRLEPEWQWPNSAGESLDLGVVPTSHTTQVRGTVYNGNPVPICVAGWGADMEGAALQFLGCPARQPNPTTCSCIAPGESGVLSLSAVAPVREGPVRGVVWLQTNHARLQVSVTLRAARGRLLARPLNLVNCFPGTVCSARLSLDSSLSFSMKLLNVTSDPPDIRVYHNVTAEDGSWDIAALSAGHNGRIYFAAGLACHPHCYTCVRFDSNSQVELWLNRPSIEEDWLSTDAALLEYHQQMFANLTARHMAHNLTLRLHTSEVLNQLISGTARWIWPLLHLPDNVSNAGLVGVGGESAYNLTIVNPSTTEPVYVHALLASGPMHRVPPWLHGECEQSSCSWSPRSFRITAVYPEGATVVRDGPSPAVLVPPGATAKLQIKFTPHSAVQHVSVLYLRNNLTILEAVHLTGQGAYPSFKFGNRKPGSGTPLLFELTEKHLKDCDRDKTRLSIPPNLTVKRSFTARNTGDIPITISTFYINGFECEGYGFKVLNCGGFELNPNATHKVDIAFTPDFTLSKIKRTLILVSSLSTPVNYSLVTTVPAHLLAPCSAALTRPPWETYVRNVVVSFMICIGLCVLAAGFMESDRILKMATAAMTRNTPVQPPLDLRNIGQSKPWEWSDPPDRHKKTTWNEERGLLEEKIGKYEEFVPQKNKKKLSKIEKKCSNEPSMTEIPIAKELNAEKKEEEWREKEPMTNIEVAMDNKSEDGDNSTPPNESTDTTPLVPPSETPPERKILDLPNKILNSISSEPSSKKRHGKNERRQTRCEEDASSTATESSNNDEPEKEPEPQVRASTERNVSKKSSPANSKKKCPAQYKDSYEGDGEDEEYDRPNKPNTPQTFPGVTLKFNRNKDNNTPTPTRQTKTVTQSQVEQVEKPKSSLETKSETPPEPVHQSKPKAVTHKLITNKKEKLPKKKIDKVPFTLRTENTMNSYPSRNSPPVVTAPMSRWGENRATFSDVVSRSETSTFSTIGAPKKPDKFEVKRKESPPGLNSFVKKEKVPLGPIGSNFMPKRSPTGHSEDNDSLYCNPSRQITELPVKFEVPTDNNNSFFYFGTDNVRSPEILPPREVGVIGKPNCATFPTPIGQSYSQVNYSPSLMEGGRMIGDRMEFDSGWDQRTGSPGLVAASNTTNQASAFNRSVYSADTGSAFTDLWNMPTTIANNVGAVGQTSSMAAGPPTSDQWFWYNGMRPPPGFPPQQQPISRQFDPFQSMSSIWSPVTQDAWSSSRNDENQQQ